MKIVFAERDIAEGEEICISYQSFNDLSREYSHYLSEAILKTKWGIICPQDCVCRDPAIQKLIDQSRKLQSSFVKMVCEGNAKGALGNAQLLMKNQEKIHSPWIDKIGTLFDAFQFAIMKKNTLKLGQEYAKQLYEIASAIWSPEDEEVREYERYMKNPQIHRVYLILEQGGR